MLSLKYKNLVKEVLFEEITDADIKHNIESKSKLDKLLDSYDSINNLFWVKDNPGEMSIFVYDGDKKRDVNDLVSITIYTIKLTYDMNHTIIDVLNPITNQYLVGKNWVDELSKKINSQPITIKSVINITEDLFSEFRTTTVGRSSEELVRKDNLMNPQYQKDTFDKLDDTERKELTDDYKEKLNNLGIYTNVDKGIEETNISSSTDTNTKEEFAFNPSNFVGDDKYRKVDDVKNLVERNLLNYEKKRSEENKDSIEVDEMAAAILYNAVETAVSSNPCQLMYINTLALYNKSLEIQKNSEDSNALSLPNKFSKNDEEVKKLDYDKEVSSKDFKGIGRKSKTGKTTNGIELKKMLAVDPPEILSPMAFAKMNIPIQNWSVDARGISAKVMVDYIFNRYNKNALNDAEIRYFPTTNEPLVDSQIRVKINDNQYATIGISTKGGANGEGAAASTTSLFGFLLDTPLKGKHPYANELRSKFKTLIGGLTEGRKKSNDSSTSDQIITPTMTTKDEFGHTLSDYQVDNRNLPGIIRDFMNKYCKNFIEKRKSLYNQYFKEIMLIVMFGALPPSLHGRLIRIISAYPNDNKVFTNRSKFCNAYNTVELSDLMMRLLDIQKFDFAQVNCKPHFSGETYKYDYFVQYPAKFVGQAKLEAKGNGIRFHILGR